MKKKRTEITVEIERALIIKRAESVVYAWCPQCDRQVSMISPEAAAALTRTSVREIFRQIEASELHFLETPEGQVHICSASIRRA